MIERNKIYKFIGFSNKKISGIDKKKLKSITGKQIYVSKYTMLNDPYEAKCYFDDVHHLLGENIFEKLTSNHLIASFTYENQNSSPMWAHYANNHSGICIEFNVKNKELLNRIRYISEQESIEDDIEVLKNEVLRNGYKTTIIPQELVDKISVLFNSKHKSWEYENEVRYINQENYNRRVKYGKNVDYSKVGIEPKSIYLGLNIGAEHKREITNICKNQCILLYKMKLSNVSKKFQYESEIIL